MLDDELLTSTWDFADPRGSEGRLRAVREASTDPVERDEYTTQVARALGLQGKFEQGVAELATIDNDAAVVQVRVHLERGRLANSGGDRAGSIASFQHAAGLADEAGLTYLLVDALHMLAIVDEEHSGDWAERGIALARTGDRSTQVWLIALNNNRGWDYYDEGRFTIARQYFEQALEHALQLGTQRQIQLAREAIAECETAARREAEDGYGEDD